MNKKRSGLLALVLLDVLLFVIGVGLLMIAHNRQDGIAHDLARDIGIAFIVSGLVTLAYERYARTRFDLGRISSLLDTVYGSNVPLEVWESIKDTLLKREIIRRNTNLHLRVGRDQQAGETNVVLDLDLAYDLQSLQSRTSHFEVVHGLDEHITAHELPRFIYASIGARSENIGYKDSWRTPDGEMRLEKGRLSLRVGLQPLGEVLIRTRRIEVRECPGSYYLIMTEITDGMHIYLDYCAPDVGVQLIVRPPERIISLKEGKPEIIEEPLLPGYSLEFTFTKLPGPLLAEQV
jgi:hypothetical protein